MEEKVKVKDEEVRKDTENGREMKRVGLGMNIGMDEKSEE